MCARRSEAERSVRMPGAQPQSAPFQGDRHRTKPRRMRARGRDSTEQGAARASAGTHACARSSCARTRRMHLHVFLLETPAHARSDPSMSKKVGLGPASSLALVLTPVLGVAPPSSELSYRTGASASFGRDRTASRPPRPVKRRSNPARQSTCANEHTHGCTSCSSGLRHVEEPDSTRDYIHDWCDCSI